MAYRVERAGSLVRLLSDSKREHSKIEEDLDWLEARLSESPQAMGDQVPGLNCAYPVYKTRCKDSCCGLGARGGWRVYYCVKREALVVVTFFILHKRVEENPGKTYLNQQIERAFAP